MRKIKHVHVGSIDGGKTISVLYGDPRATNREQRVLGSYASIAEALANKHRDSQPTEAAKKNWRKVMKELKARGYFHHDGTVRDRARQACYDLILELDRPVTADEVMQLSEAYCGRI